MKDDWTDEALDNLTSLRNYIAEHDERAAAKCAARIINAVDLIKSYPNMGRAMPAGGREHVVPGTPAIIRYRVKNKTLQILAVPHYRQNR